MDNREEISKCVEELISYHYTFEQANILATNMIGKPDYYYPDELMDTQTVIDYALECHLLANNRYGWLDPDGNFYGCSYASHDKLCYFLGFNSVELENNGWLRISFCVKGLRKPTLKQRKFLKKNNIDLEHNYLMVYG